MKRSGPPKRKTPLRSKRSGPARRRTLPRCVRRGCDRIARIDDLCVSHAEREADRRFSLYVRRRDESCTAYGVLDGVCSDGLVAAHGVGRRAKRTRFDPENVHALCPRHHVLVDGHGHEAEKYRWLVSRLGPDRYAALMERAREPLDRDEAIEATLAWLPIEPLGDEVPTGGWVG